MKIETNMIESKTCFQHLLQYINLWNSTKTWKQMQYINPISINKNQTKNTSPNHLNQCFVAPFNSMLNNLRSRGNAGTHDIRLGTETLKAGDVLGELAKKWFNQQKHRHVRVVWGLHYPIYDDSGNENENITMKISWPHCYLTGNMVYFRETIPKFRLVNYYRICLMSLR